MADEYLLRQLDGTEIRGPALILDDVFGALSCVLTEHKPCSIGNSYISESATCENLRPNGTDESSVKFLDGVVDYPQQPGVMLTKAPKTPALPEQQLHVLCKAVMPDTRITASAEARDICTSTLELLEKVLGPTATTPTWKEAYLINCIFNELPLTDVSQTVSWKLEGTDWITHNHTNTFSRTGLDTGAHFFMQHLPENLESEIADLGCGNGVIGLTLLDKNPQARVVSVDESSMAVASSRLNVRADMPRVLDYCEFMINNASSGVEPFRFNTVFCSPSFRQQHVPTDNATWKVFHHARHCLKINSELYIVTNRHPDYFHKLEKIFGNCTAIAMNNKFVVSRAVELRCRR